jgi:hypothetical protein
MTKDPLKIPPSTAALVRDYLGHQLLQTLFRPPTFLLTHKKRGFCLHAPAPARHGNTFNCRQALSEPGQTQQTRLDWEVPQVPHALDVHADQGGTFAMLLEKTPILFWRRPFRSFDWWASSPAPLQASGPQQRSAVPTGCRSHALPSVSLLYSRACWTPSAFHPRSGPIAVRST